MLLVIHNFPSNIKYSEIKSLLQSKCGLTDVILDNLVSEGLTKRVTVGLADDGDAAILVRKINGLYVGGMQLHVEDVRQKASEQPYISSKTLLQQPINYEPYQPPTQRDLYKNQSMQGPNEYQSPLMGLDQTPLMVNYNVPMSGGMYYVPQIPIVPANQSSYMGFNDQSRQIPSLMPQVPEVRARQEPFGFRSGVEDNRPRDWGSDSNRHPDNRQRSRQLPDARQRGGSPPRGLRPEPLDRRMSRRDEPQPEPQYARRRSRSPMRDNWGSGDRFDNRAPAAPAYAKFYNDAIPVGRNSSSQNYAEQRTFGRSEHFPSNADLMQSKVFRDRVEFSVNNTDYRRDQPRNNRGSLNLPATFQPQRGRQDNAQTSRGGQLRGSNSFESRNFDGPRFNAPSKLNTPRSEPRKLNERRETFPGPNRMAAQKRIQNKWGNDEPQPKRFASMPQKADAPNNRNWREQGQQIFQSQVQPNFPRRPTAAGRTPNPFERDLGNKNPTQKKQMASLINRDDTWRGQAAASIARKMIAVLKIELKPSDKIFYFLKKSIRSRINVILGDKLSKSPDDVVVLYRSKFPTSGDQKLFQDVVEAVKQENENTTTGESGDVKPNKVSENDVKPANAPQKTAKAPQNTTKAPQNTAKAPQNTAKAPQNTAKAPQNTAKAPQNTAKAPQNTAKAPQKTAKEPQKTVKATPQKSAPATKSNLLPTYPNADKKEYNKKRREPELTEEEKELTPALKRAVEEEADTLCDLFMSECLSPDKAQDKFICEQIADVVSDDYKKIITDQLTKRLHRGKRYHLSVRAIFQTNNPDKLALSKFVQQKFGAIALKKSVHKKKLFIVSVNTYANYDRLLRMASVKIGDAIVDFKPLHILGVPPTVKEMRNVMLERKKKFYENFEDSSTETLLAPGYTSYPTVDPNCGNTTKTGDADNGENEELQENITSANDENENDNQDYEEVGDDEFGDEDDAEQENHGENLDLDDLEDY